mmetsp:Transcript_21372/g.9868  ORF Transcript_21372/g.9868 Transcript_21372/m.9868 type:complete len:95 (-) Transcript_21372:95-379(-)
MDKSGTGHLNGHDLFRGLIDILDLWFSEEEVGVFTKFLDEDNSGTVEVNEFESKLNLVNSKNRKKDAWLVSKSSLLTAIADEYDEKKMRDAVKL